MLENYGITPENATNGHHKITLKRNVVEMAKEWPLYFARLYPVSVSVSLFSFQYNINIRRRQMMIQLLSSFHHRVRDNTPMFNSWPFPILASVWSSASRSANWNRCTCCNRSGKPTNPQLISFQKSLKNVASCFSSSLNSWARNISV